MKKINWIVVGYFFIGLFIWVGLIFGGFLIKFKEKTNKSLKIKSLVSGFVVALLFSLVIGPHIIQPEIEKTMYKKYPETIVVRDAVKAQYPNGNVEIGLGWDKSYDSQYGSRDILKMDVDYESKNELAESDLKNIGKISCTALKTTGKMYDDIDVVSQMPLFQIAGIPFGSKYIDISATCGTFLEDTASQ